MPPVFFVLARDPNSWLNRTPGYTQVCLSAMTSLIYLPENPGPAADLDGYLETGDGFRIRHAVFRTTKHSPKGTIVVLQGRNECIEKYFETITEILQRGFDVATFDWRGQGGSTRFWQDRRRGHIDTYDQYSADLDLVFTEVVLPECRAPFFILAHSTGALAALYAAPSLVNRVKRMVLCSPFLGIGDERLSAGQVRFLSRLLRMIGLGSMYLGGSAKGMPGVPFELNRLTTDPERYARNQKIMDPDMGLGLGSATATWLHASAKALERVYEPEHMARIHIPTLMMLATADRVVSTRAIENYAGRIRSGALVSIDGARHELMQEADAYRSQMLAAFDAFIPGSD